MMRQKHASEKCSRTNQNCIWNCCLGIATPMKCNPMRGVDIHTFPWILTGSTNRLPSNLRSKLKTTNLSLSEIYPLPFELHKIKNGTEANYKAAHHCWNILKWTAQGRFLMHFPPLFLLHCVWVCWLQCAGSTMQRGILGCTPYTSPALGCAEPATVQYTETAQYTSRRCTSAF